MSGRRLWIVVAGLVGATAGVGARTVQVMLVQHESWAQLARRQHERVITVPGEPGLGRAAAADAGRSLVCISGAAVVAVGPAVAVGIGVRGAAAANPR